MASYTFKANAGDAPRDAVDVGCELSGQRWLFTGRVHTANGLVGAKVDKSSMRAHYAEGDREKIATDFEWLTTIKPVSLFRHNKSHGKPKNTVKIGRTTGAERDSFATLAITEKGLIPGTAETDTCTYTYKGDVYTTEYFLWLVCE